MNNTVMWDDTGKNKVDEMIKETLGWIRNYNRTDDAYFRIQYDTNTIKVMPCRYNCRTGELTKITHKYEYGVDDLHEAYVGMTLKDFHKLKTEVKHAIKKGFLKGAYVEFVEIIL